MRHRTTHNVFKCNSDYEIIFTCSTIGKVFHGLGIKYKLCLCALMESMLVYVNIRTYAVCYITIFQTDSITAVFSSTTVSAWRSASEPVFKIIRWKNVTSNYRVNLFASRVDPFHGYCTVFMKKERVSADFSKRVDALWKLLLLIDFRQGSLKIKFSFADARHHFMATTGKNI